MGNRIDVIKAMTIVILETYHLDNVFQTYKNREIYSHHHRYKTVGLSGMRVCEHQPLLFHVSCLVFTHIYISLFPSLEHCLYGGGRFQVCADRL
jgi:hypothetical protein